MYVFVDLQPRDRALQRPDFRLLGHLGSMAPVLYKTEKTSTGPMTGRSSPPQQTHPSSIEKLVMFQLADGTDQKIIRISPGISPNRLMCHSPQPRRCRNTPPGQCQRESQTTRKRCGAGLMGRSLLGGVVKLVTWEVNGINPLIGGVVLRSPPVIGGAILRIGGV